MSGACAGLGRRLRLSWDLELMLMLMRQPDLPLPLVTCAPSTGPARKHQDVEAVVGGDF